MTAPNIVNVTSIYGKTMGVGLTTTTTTGILTCGANNTLRINSIIASNIDAVNNAEVTVYFYDSSVAERYAIASTIIVPIDSTLVIIGKDSPIYLEESDRIEAGANADGDLEMIISYDQIS